MIATLGRLLPAFALAATVAPVATAQTVSPIYLKPGQCILVGAQQVCAIREDDPRLAARPTVVHTCRYGELEGSEIPNGKGWNHFMISVREDGSKTETLIKSYGPLDEHKKECESDAQKVQSRMP